MNEERLFDPTEILKAAAKLEQLQTNAAYKEQQVQVRLQELKLGHIREQQEMIIDFEFKKQKMEEDLAQESIKKEQELREKAIQKEFEIKKAAQDNFYKIKEQEIKKAEKAAEKKAKKENRTLTEAERKQIRERYKYEGDVRKKFEEKAAKERAKKDKENAIKAGNDWLKEQNENLFGKGQKLSTRLSALKELTTSVGANGKRHLSIGKSFAALSKTLSSFTQQLDTTINSIAKNRGIIDTRLQGSSNDKWFGSYWDNLNFKVTGLAGISPIYRQEDIVNNIKTLVGRGIAFNVDQRAFLQTISEKIATTFDAANGTLLRLVRIQQQDTTAGRLGMESALTSFLNQMYETSEYMSDMVTSVKGNLEEAMALMSGSDAVAFEYQVQKWMGSLYSVGMSQTAVSNIAGALGRLAAGDISGITNGGAGNLLVMAANQAGGSISDMLRAGLDESSTNALLNSAVNYLGQLYLSASDSLVVQQQLANVYGVTASDLKAAINLMKHETTMSSIVGNGLNYEEAIGKLLDMANSMISRTSYGEISTNLWDNFQYSLSAGIAGDPITYGIYKAAGLLKDVAGGMPIPAVSVLGNMVDLETTVADVMTAGALASSIVKGIVAVAKNGGGGLFGGAAGALRSFGINETKSPEIVSRGEVKTSQRMADLLKQQGYNVTRENASGEGVSSSGNIPQTNYQVNTNSEDMINSTTLGAQAKGNKQLSAAKEKEEQDVTIEVVDAHIINIYNLLQEVVDGTSSLHVTMPLNETINGWN